MPGSAESDAVMINEPNMYRVYNAGWIDGWIDNDAFDGSEILLTS